MINFEPEPEFQAKLDWTKAFCERELLPLNYLMMADREDRRAGRTAFMESPKFKRHIAKLQDQVKGTGSVGPAPVAGTGRNRHGPGQAVPAQRNPVAGRHGPDRVRDPRP